MVQGGADSLRQQGSRTATGQVRAGGGGHGGQGGDQPRGRAGPGASEGFFRNSQQQLQTSLVCVTLFSFLVQQYHKNTGHIGFAT